MPHLRCRIQEESSMQRFVFVFRVTNEQERSLVQIVFRSPKAGLSVYAAPSPIDSNCLQRVSQMRVAPRICDGNHDARVMLANMGSSTDAFAGQKSVRQRAFWPATEDKARNGRPFQDR